MIALLPISWMHNELISANNWVTSAAILAYSLSTPLVAISIGRGIKEKRVDK